MVQRVETEIELANRLVPLPTVLEWFGVFVPEFTHGKSVKARCPYADMFHLDDYSSKSMRVYSDTNTGNCFMGCGIISPVSVFAKMNDISFKEAAKYLLAKAGYKAKSFQEKWEEAVNPPKPLDRVAFREALIEYCLSKSKGEWTSLQYSPDISCSLSRVLRVLETAKSVDDADRWLEVSKDFMSRIINRKLSETSDAEFYRD